MDGVPGTCERGRDLQCRRREEGDPCSSFCLLVMVFAGGQQSAFSLSLNFSAAVAEMHSSPLDCFYHLLPAVLNTSSFQPKIGRSSLHNATSTKTLRKSKSIYNRASYTRPKRPGPLSGHCLDQKLAPSRAPHKQPKRLGCPAIPTSSPYLKRIWGGPDALDTGAMSDRPAMARAVPATSQHG